MTNAQLRLLLLSYKTDNLSFEELEDMEGNPVIEVRTPLLESSTFPIENLQYEFSVENKGDVLSLIEVLGGYSPRSTEVYSRGMDPHLRTDFEWLSITSNLSAEMSLLKCWLEERVGDDELVKRLQTLSRPEPLFIHNGNVFTSYLNCKLTESQAVSQMTRNNEEFKRLIHAKAIDDFFENPSESSYFIESEESIK